jgi:hypothetical protein
LLLDALERDQEDDDESAYLRRLVTVTTPGVNFEVKHQLPRLVEVEINLYLESRTPKNACPIRCCGQNGLVHPLTHSMIAAHPANSSFIRAKQLLPKKSVGTSI